MTTHRAAKLVKEIASYEDYRAVLLRCEAEHDRSNPQHVAEVATYPALFELVDAAIVKLRAGFDSWMVSQWFWDEEGQITRPHKYLSV